MKPVICNYYLTYRCNARCSFCSIWNSKKVSASDEAPSHVVCQNLTAARKLGVRIVDFTGGEPLLYDGIGDALSHAKKSALFTTVTTNGILYPQRAHEIKGLVNILQFSIDSSDRETHDKIRGVRSFDKVMESVEKSRSIGEKPTFIHTVTDDNISGLEGVVSLAEFLKVPLFLNPCFSYFGNEGFSKENINILKKTASRKGVTVDRGFLNFIGDGGNKKNSPRCLAVSSVIVISPDDKLILPCFHFSRREIPINGNLAGVRDSAETLEEKSLEGRLDFCEGCTVYCYIRASLFRRFDRYFLPSVFSGVDYIFKYYFSK